MVIRECTITKTPKVITFQLDHAELTVEELLDYIERWRGSWGQKGSNCYITETLDGIEFHRKPNESERSDLEPCSYRHE